MGLQSKNIMHAPQVKIALIQYFAKTITKMYQVFNNSTLGTAEFNRANQYSVMKLTCECYLIMQFYS